jgi:hypothetical protein
MRQTNTPFRALGLGKRMDLREQLGLAGSSRFATRHFSIRLALRQHPRRGVPSFLLRRRHLGRSRRKVFLDATFCRNVADSRHPWRASQDIAKMGR